MYLFLAIFALLATFQFILELSANRLNLSKACSSNDKSDRVLYLQANTRLTYASLILNFSLYIFILIANPFKIGNNLYSHFTNLYILALYLTLFFILLNFSISLILSYVKVFKIESKFGFNNMNLSLFFQDKAKALLLELAVTVPMVLLAIYSYQKFKYLLPLALYLVFQFFTLFIYLYGVRFLLPLFNKLEELPNGELRDKLESLLKDVDFPLSKLSVINASKRNSKGNAFFSGMGKVKNIVLYDTLIELLTPSEIVAVLAHEIGHYKLKHTFKNYLMQSFGALALAALLILFLDPEFSAHYLTEGHNNIVNQIIFIFLLTMILSFYQSLITLRATRKYEIEADFFAGKLGYAQDLISGLNKLSLHAKANPFPHNLYISLYYSHPPTHIRAEKLLTNHNL